MRIRIHSNSRVDVLNLKRKAYKKGKDTKPFKGIVKFHGKKRSVKSKRNYIARRKTTKPEWLAGRGATSYPASTSSSCSEKSPKEEITDEDDLDGLNQLSRNSQKSHGQLNGKTKITRGAIGKCVELENDDEKENESNKSESSESDSSSSSSSGSGTSSSCSNYSDISESDSDNGTIIIPTSSVTRSSSKLLSLQPLESTIYQAGRDRTRKGSDKENSSPTPRKTLRSTRNNLQHTGNRACCSSRELVDVHYKSPVELNSVSETIQPGTGSKNLSFLMQHLADRIRGERVREDLERTVRPSAHVHFVHSQTKHAGRSQREIQPPRSHLPLIHRYEHPKQGSNNAPSNTSLAIPKLNGLVLNRVNHEKDYFPNFENIADFEEIPKTFEDFDMSTFHDFNEFEGRFDLEWEFVDELVRDSCAEPKSKPKGYHLCKCQDESRIKQEAIKTIENTLRRFEFGHDSSFATGRFYSKDREKVFSLNTISSHFTTWLSDAAN